MSKDPFAGVKVGPATVAPGMSPADLGLETDTEFEFSSDGIPEPTLLSEGRKLFRCIKAEQGVNQKGNKQFTFTLKVETGDEKGKQIWVNASLLPTALWKFFSHLRAFGIEGGDSAYKFKASDLVNKLVWGDVFHDTYNDKTKAKVDVLTKYEGELK